MKGRKSLDSFWAKGLAVLRASALACLLLLVAPQAGHAVVTYEWQPDIASAGTGTLTFPDQPDPGFFINVAPIGFSFTFVSGLSLTLADVNASLFDAFMDRLVAGTITALAPSTTGLSIGPGQVVCSNCPGPPLTNEDHTGFWALQADPNAIPEPSSFALFIAALAGLGFFLRRQTA